MGQYDIFVIGGVVLIGGYYLITNPDILQGLFPPSTQPTDGQTPPVDDTTTSGNGDGTSTGDGGGGSACKNYCANCACRSYNQKCSGSCSRCQGGNRIPSKCGLGGPSGSFGGGSSDTGGGTGTASGNSSKSDDCRKFCNNGWCTSYRRRGCSGGCNQCQKGSISSGGTKCPSTVYNSQCAGNCNQTCWRGHTGPTGGTISQVCVSKTGASACSAAKAAFLKKYAGLAKIYPAQAYPYEEAMRISIA